MTTRPDCVSELRLQNYRIPQILLLHIYAYNDIGEEYHLSFMNSLNEFSITAICMSKNTQSHYKHYKNSHKDYILREVFKKIMFRIITHNTSVCK